jgi:hypothetical protein
MESRRAVISFDEYTPSLPCAQGFHKIGEIRIRPADPDGFYAKTFLENCGWEIERYGETKEQAEQGLRDYIMSGRFDEDRNR